MPVSKKRKQNTRPTQSKNISTQMSSSGAPSPRWYVITMFSLMSIGVLLIVLNYLTLLPGSVSRWYLWSGLALIGGGFLMTTNYN
jgi:hypothetical protein